MNKRIIYPLVGLAVIFFVVSLIVFLNNNHKPAKTKQSLPSPTLENTNENTNENIVQPERLQVKTFFFAETSRFMLPVPGEIEISAIREDAYRQFLQLLLDRRENYISPVPEGTQLRTLYLIKKQELLVLDFSEELVHKFPSGTATELEFIYFFVNNFCYNFKEVKKVKFLIGGNEYRTISGHIDIAHPFYPNFRYLKEEE